MKKFITLLAIVAAILALTTIGVSAVAGYVDDFSEPPVDGKIENYTNWKFYSASVKDGVTWEDGMVRFERLSSNGLIWNISTNLNNPVNFTMFDAKFNEVGAVVGISGYYVNFGFLKWDGGSSRYAIVKDMPRHSLFSLGDTIVTSGHSAVFPGGIPVGTVEDITDSHDGLSYLIKVKLFTDFGRLNDVRVIARKEQEELMELEKRLKKGKK